MSRPGQSQAQLLDAAIKDAAISRATLARLMLGEDADQKQLKNRRRLILKWLKGDNRISDPNAILLARAFNKIKPGRYPDSYFLGDPGRPLTWAEEMAKVYADLDELREEVKRLKEAS